MSDIQPVQDIGEMMDEISARDSISVMATIKVEEPLIRPLIGVLIFLERSASQSITDLDVRERISVAAQNMRKAIYFGDEEANRTESGLAAMIEQEQKKQAGERLNQTAGRLAPGFARLPRITATLASDLAFLFDYPHLGDPGLQKALADPEFAANFRGAVDAFLVLIDYAEGMISSMLFIAAQASASIQAITIEDDPQKIIDIGRSKR